MAHSTRRDPDLVVSHHRASSLEFVNGNYRAWIRVAFVGHPRFDVELLIFQEVAGQLAQANWAVSVDVALLSSDPSVVNQCAVLEVVIGMMMRDENVAQTVERDSG